jgi:hypothetical protein
MTRGTPRNLRISNIGKCVHHVEHPLRYNYVCMLTMSGFSKHLFGLASSL